MRQDIDIAVRGWEFKPGLVQARLVQASDNRQVIQMRVDLGLLQLETSGRPDGAKPHGHATYHDYVRAQAALAGEAGQTFVLSEEQCQESDREFSQFYHRRICWLALRNYSRAVEDADHTLAFMDLVKGHSPDEEYTRAHEQYRGFVVFQRTQAAAALAVERDDPAGAVDAIADGLARLQAFFAEHGLEEEMEEHGMVQHLRKLQRSLREAHSIEETLQEQLEKAVANEDYEVAARLRDALRASKQKDVSS